MKNCILVCVTAQEGCVRLIRKGSDLARQRGAAMHVLHVSQNGKNHGEADAAILNTLYSLSREAQADMTVLYEQDVAAAIVRYANETGAGTLILGSDRTGMIARVKALLPEDTELLIEEEAASFYK